MTSIENIVDVLNRHCYLQTENSGLALEPFEYRTTGTQWSVWFLDFPIADDEEQGTMELEEFEKFIVQEVDKILNSLRLIQLSQMKEKSADCADSFAPSTVSLS